MLVIKVEPGKAAYATDIDAGLESLQAQVGGYIQAVYPWKDKAAIICNDEGKVDGLPLNRALRDSRGKIYDAIAGTFLVVGLGEESFCDLTEEQTVTYGNLFRRPEEFLVIGKRIVAVPA